jgi:hypothetical protein
MKIKNIKKEVAGFEPPPPLEVPAGPLVIFDDKGVATGCTQAGLELVRAASAEGFSQISIASKLGIGLKTFERLLGKADSEPMSEVRAAWELGFGDLKSELVRLCLAGARRGGLVQSLFLLKSLFQFRDQGPAIAIDNGPRIQFTLPAPMSEEDYLKKLGIEAPIDVRPIELRGKSPVEIMGIPQLPAPTTKGE